MSERHSRIMCPARMQRFDVQVHAMRGGDGLTFPCVLAWDRNKHFIAFLGDKRGAQHTEKLERNTSPRACDSRKTRDMPREPTCWSNS